MSVTLSGGLRWVLLESWFALHTAFDYGRPSFLGAPCAQAVQHMPRLRSELRSELRSAL